MLNAGQIDELIGVVARMDREDLVQECLHFEGRFPVDFTPAFLDGLEIDRLRHIYVAMCLQNGHVPALHASAA